MKQQFCVCCGNGSDKLTRRVDRPRNQPYDGNQIVLRTDHFVQGSYEGTDYTVWDGETYRPLKYGSFCKLRCAHEFAEAAVRAGFKRSS